MIETKSYNCIKIEKHDRLAIVTLNMPEQMNVFDAVMHKEMEMLFGQLGQDESINSIVLTGAGKMFSAGGDIKMMQGGAIPPPEEAISLINNLLRVKQPLIAAVNGHAMGVGATIALFCDIVIASEEAKIGDPHVKVGLVAGDGGCVIWPLLIGINKAKEFLMSGRPIGAREAERIGLINHCVPSADVLPKAMEIARELADGPSKAIQWTKMSCNKRLVDEVNLILAASTGFEYLSMHSEDHTEAVSAFIEKRKPKFTGK